MARYIRREQKERKQDQRKEKKRNPTFLLLLFDQSHSAQ
jgi:hypothetical protein